MSIIILILPIRSVIPIITIALRAIPNSGQSNVLLPGMDKEWAVPATELPNLQEINYEKLPPKQLL